MNFSEQRWVITGASGGIGAAIAKELAQRGATLLLCGRNQIKLAHLKAKLVGQHQLFVGDLTQASSLSELQQAADRFNANGVINCLGVNQLQTFVQSSDADIRQMLDTNLLTPISVCQALLPRLQTQPSATLVNVGSILGSIGYPGATLYCASKFGLRGFTESLRRELADSHVNVLYFAPRATDTEINSPAMQQLNQQLGNKSDSPMWVAQQLCQRLQRSPKGAAYLGWPEKLFVRINALFPGLVDGASLKQLPIIKRFCQQQPSSSTATGEHHEAS
ncbi:SDR family oxidoreductase [Shewanella sp. A3A]|nr:SDR family oxidoreductase [Shewanella ferrihydritica]